MNCPAPPWSAPLSAARSAPVARSGPAARSAPAASRALARPVPFVPSARCCLWSQS